MTRITKQLAYVAALLLTAGLIGCGDTSNPDPGPGPDEQDIPNGATEFVSADGNAGQASQENDGEATAGAADEDSRDSGGGERSVEEGDIYRVLSGDLILNLNAYRGLQVIDFADVSDPTIIGRVRSVGTPVEMYVVDDTAYVLLNNWRGYYGSRDDIQVEQVTGGLVMVVDLRDPEAPVVTSRARVPGWIRTSRLTRGDGGEALYVVSNDWEGDSQTRVRSFGTNDAGKLIERSSIDLGGYVQDIQATTEALLVARYDYTDDRNRSKLAIIDISNPDGTMVEGAEVTLEGRINNKTNMNLYGDVLRVASGNSWGNGTNTNHLETFDVSDIHNPSRVDHETFGDGEQLFATLFLGNKAFFVTYLRVDPFHAFYIDDDGNCEEKNEYIISGWNDYFRPIANDSRLIGIGMNDEEGRTMAVSLYNTDLEDDDPFIARAEVEADNSWSEARWDDRAFSVLESAVDVQTDDGVAETGLVLLPFSGYDNEQERYLAAVQIFTFSENTLTRRGVMQHGTMVRRSFVADDEVTANLSEAELSLFDHSNPDEPVELGRVDLAPNVTNFLTFGDHGVRFHSNSGWWWWYYGDRDTGPDELEIISLEGDPDVAPALATIEVTRSSQIFKVGDLLVSFAIVNSEYVDEEYTYTSHVQVFDLSDPTSPELVSEFETTELNLSNNYYGGGYYDEMGDSDCYNCGGYAQANAHVVSEALVFVQSEYHQEVIGHEEVCNSYPRDRYGDEYNCWGDDGPQECSYTTGNISCRSLDGAPEICTGSYYRCTQDSEGETTCDEIAQSSVSSEEHCYDYDRYRYWNTYSFTALDLSDAANPSVTDSLSFDEDEQAVGVMVDGDTLLMNYKVEASVEGDSRDFVRYYVRAIDYSTPAAPSAAPRINVPGQLLEVDGNSWYTRDFVWGDEIVETAVNRVRVHEGRAYLEARRVFRDVVVNNMALDGEGHLLLTKQQSWYQTRRPDFDWEDMTTELVILDAEDDFRRLAEEPVDRWATLRSATSGRALFSVPGGLLVMNTSNAANPYAQAYFPTMGWPSTITTVEREIYIAAGRYGMYRFSLDAFNLLDISTPL